MQQKLLVHIGAIKTGSSAIQRFLAHNAVALRRAGILVPDAFLKLSGQISGTQVPFFEKNDGTSTAEAARHLHSHVESLFNLENVRQIVLSAENLSEGTTSPVTPAWFREVAKEWDVEVLVYLRRQDDLLLSSWQQWDAKIHSDFWSWAISRVGVLGNWRILLERWESAVTRERIHVRLYERRHLVGGDVVTDFEGHLGTEKLNLERSAVRENRSLTNAIVDLVPGSGLFVDINDDGFYRFAREMLGEDAFRAVTESQLSLEQRLAIVGRYEESNAWVRDAYFHAEDVPLNLFESPERAAYKVWTRDELRRRQMQLLARLVFEVGKRRPT